MNNLFFSIKCKYNACRGNGALHSGMLECLAANLPEQELLYVQRELQRLIAFRCAHSAEMSGRKTRLEETNDLHTLLGAVLDGNFVVPVLLTLRFQR